MNILFRVFAITDPLCIAYTLAYMRPNRGQLGQRITEGKRGNEYSTRREILRCASNDNPKPAQLSRSLRRNPLRVAVLARDGVDVVFALRGEEGRVHLLDLDAAMGVGRVA